VREAGQPQAGWSHPVVGTWPGLACPGLRGGVGPGLVTVLGQQVGGRGRGGVAGAVLRGAVALAGVTRPRLAGQREALGRPRVDELVVLVVTDHHLLQTSGAHRVVLKPPRAGLKVTGGRDCVVVMRRLLTSGTPGSHQLLGGWIAGAGLVMVVTNLVEAVGVGRGSAGGSLDWSSVHPAGSSAGSGSVALH